MSTQHIATLQGQINSLINQLRNYVGNLAGCNLNINAAPNLYQLYCYLKTLVKFANRNCQITLLPSRQGNVLTLPGSPPSSRRRQNEYKISDAIKEYRERYSVFQVLYEDPVTGIHMKFFLFYNLCIPHRISNSYRSILCQSPDVAFIMEHDHDKYDVIAIKEIKYTLTGKTSFPEWIRTIIGYEVTLVNRSKALFLLRMLNEFSEVIVNIDIRHTNYWNDKVVKNILLEHNIRIVSEII